MASTKVHLDPAVLEDLQALAAHSAENLDHLLNRLLREALDRRRTPQTSATRFQWHTVAQGEPAPGFDPAKRDYLDMLDERS